MNTQNHTPYISELASAVGEQFSYRHSQREDSHGGQHPPATGSLPGINPGHDAIFHQPTDSHGSRYGYNTGERSDLPNSPVVVYSAPSAQPAEIVKLRWKEGFDHTTLKYPSDAVPPMGNVDTSKIRPGSQEFTGDSSGSVQVIDYKASRAAARPARKKTRRISPSPSKNSRADASLPSLADKPSYSSFISLPNNMVESLNPEQFTRLINFQIRSVATGTYPCSGENEEILTNQGFLYSNTYLSQFSLMEQEFHESAVEHIQAVIESEEISPGVSRVLKHGKRVARSKLIHELLSTGKYAHVEFNDVTEIAQITALINARLQAEGFQRQGGLPPMSDILQSDLARATGEIPNKTSDSPSLWFHYVNNWVEECAVELICHFTDHSCVSQHFLRKPAEELLSILGLAAAYIAFVLLSDMMRGKAQKKLTHPCQDEFFRRLVKSFTLHVAWLYKTTERPWLSDTIERVRISVAESMKYTGFTKEYMENVKPPLSYHPNGQNGIQVAPGPY